MRGTGLVSLGLGVIGLIALFAIPRLLNSDQPAWAALVLMAAGVLGLILGLIAVIRGNGRLGGVLGIVLNLIVGAGGVMEWTLLGSGSALA